MAEVTGYKCKLTFIIQVGQLVKVLTTLFTTSWPPLSQRKVQIIQHWYNGTVNNVTLMNSIPQYNNNNDILLLDISF